MDSDKLLRGYEVKVLSGLQRPHFGHQDLIHSYTLSPERHTPAPSRITSRLLSYLSTLTVLGPNFIQSTPISRRTTMAGAIVKLIGGKTMKGQVEKYFSSEDLYFEKIETVDWRGKLKTKKAKKPLPEGLTREEAALLKKVKKRAWSLDMALCNVMGTRFGWSALVGIVPG